jgi:uncharacterized repeat protein (TIGR03803 family)
MTSVRGVVASLLFLMILSVVLPAQVFTTLVNFNGPNGSKVEAPVVQGLDGELYGTTFYGGSSNVYGEVFKVSPQGVLTILYTFCYQVTCAWGDGPFSSVLQTRNGNLFGTTYVGGPSGYGSIFKISPALTGTDLANFNNTNGANPEGGLIEGIDGNFYGLAIQGGLKNVNCFFNSGCGTAFKVTPTGTLSAFYSFCSQPTCTDGLSPSGSLLQTSDGNFYGTAFGGGSYNGGGCLAGDGCGTIFKITSGGTFSTLHTFLGTDGGNPYTVALIQATDGDLYGTTYGGGPNSGCNDGNEGCGTIFKITRAGVFTSLYSFCAKANCADGSEPFAGLIQASDGNFYGTTYNGGAYNYGTVFRLTPQGKLTTIHTFCAETGCPDGEYPSAALFQSTDGKLYGTTYQGGTGQGFGIGGGTVFRMDLGLSPFVLPLPGFGKVGQTISILGYNLQKASSVSFNGVAAQFTVASGTQLTAVVPSGAKSGPIVVVTPTGTLSSKPFNVVQ